MPPRYAYWTIIVDDQPTAFRAGAKEDLLPTFNRLKAKNDTAVMMWFQNGKLWPSRVDAQEAMIGRGEAGRRGDERQSGFRARDRDFKASRPHGLKTSRERTAWTPRGEPSTPAPARNADNKLDWKPKGEFVPAPKRADRPERSERPDWKPKASRPSTYAKAPADRQDFKASRSEKPAWKPKGSFDRESKSDWKPKPFKRPAFKPSGDDTRTAKPEWKPKGSFTRESKSDWKPKGSFDRERKPDWKPRSSRPQDLKASRPEWKPKGDAPPRSPIPDPGSPAKRKWVPKEEYKKSMGIEARRDSKWRPGGEHKDPRQKYKDAKKAKWSKFKQNIRARSGGKGKKSS